MLIIPVLDLADGLVVHARRGARDSYAPIKTPLATSAAPFEVIAGILTLDSFAALYIADLDAIRGSSDHFEIIAAIAERYPALRLLIDGGFSKPQALERYRDIPSIDFVLGTESLASITHYDELLSVAGTRRTILSLDSNAAGPLGCRSLFTLPERWPARIIHMTLAQVGSGAGPDWSGLAALKAVAGDREVYAAGGVRDDSDLAQLAAINISGALVATALHEGRLCARKAPP